MAREGLFDDLDACLRTHPLDVAQVINIRTAAQSQMYIEFTGKTVDAGQTPWLGRSALDAVELFLHGVNNMREHVKPTARIHYVIVNGGLAPNIVPDKASVKRPSARRPAPTSRPASPGSSSSPRAPPS